MSEAAVAVAVCPGCGQQVRFPSDVGALHLRCPLCDESWDWPPKRALIDRRWQPYVVALLAVVLLTRIVTMVV